MHSSSVDRLIETMSRQTAVATVRYIFYCPPLLLFSVAVIILLLFPLLDA